MAKLMGPGPFPKRIEHYVVYRLPGVDEPVVRLNTGFDSETWRTAPKYAKTRRLASEFGALIRVCKLFREGLDLVLPRYNKKGICNHFVKQMYPFIPYDGVSAWGERCLSKAFACAEVREAMVGFDFNPQAKWTGGGGAVVAAASGFTYRLEVGSFLEQLVFPVGADCVGVQLHRYVFDFETGVGSLVSSALLFLDQDSVLDFASLHVSVLEGCSGVAFLLLSISFFGVEDGSFVPVVGCSDGGVRVLGCGEVI